MQDEKQTQHEAINYVHFQVTTLSDTVEECKQIIEKLSAHNYLQIFACSDFDTIRIKAISS